MTHDVAEQRADHLRGELVAALVGQRVLHDPRWRDAFEAIPRHRFLPRFFRRNPRGGWSAVAAGDPGWLARVYSDRVWVTQLDGDHHRWDTARATGSVDGTPTSSSSMPSIMAIMLEALRVRDGHTVLEIGTGTGYNAALLCHRLGDGAVATLDVDIDLIVEARRVLDGLGYHPALACADGADGMPDHAPFDRVIATCAVATIPLAWLEQTKPGGQIVTTLHRPIGAGLVRITAEEGACGHGKVLAEDGRFMPLRAHTGPDLGYLFDQIADAAGTARPTALSAHAVTSPGSPFEFFAGLGLTNVVVTPEFHGADEDDTWLLHPDGSWARHRRIHGRYVVEQDGPRALWDEVEQAYADWKRLGRPRRSRFGVTVTPESQELWLDTPDSPHRWPL